MFYYNLQFAAINGFFDLAGAGAVRSSFAGINLK